MNKIKNDNLRVIYILQKGTKVYENLKNLISLYLNAKTYFLVLQRGLLEIRVRGVEKFNNLSSV